MADHAPAQIKQFNHFNIYTVEQLSEIDDIAISRVGPGTRDFVEKAKAFIAKAKGSAEVQRFASENLAMKEQLAEQADHHQGNVGEDRCAAR
jgi:hypothetical protein